MKGTEISLILYKGLSDLFYICLQYNDVQDFDTLWDHILLGTSELPHENILEGLYKMKLQGSFQLQTVLALYICELNRKKERRAFTD